MKLAKDFCGPAAAGPSSPNSVPSRTRGCVNFVSRYSCGPRRRYGHCPALHHQALLVQCKGSYHISTAINRLITQYEAGLQPPGIRNRMYLGPYIS